MTCFCINGKTLRKYCIDNKISYTRVYYWLDKGCSIQESLIKAQSKMNRPQMKWIKGDESMYRFCKKNNLIYNSVVRAIKKGVSVDDAIDKSKKLRYIHGRPPKYIYKGDNLNVYCYKNKINYNRVYYWLNKGLELEQALMRVKNV